MSKTEAIPDKNIQASLANAVMSVGDDLLILGQRLSEWCGHAPTLEEDIALTNLALDCLGQSESFLSIAATLRGSNETPDSLAFFRDSIHYRNHLIVEQPNGDFAVTIFRIFLFSSYLYLFFTELSKSSYKPLADAAEKAIKETKYHLRHSSEWVVRLGDGTQESHARSEAAISLLWKFTGEFFTESSAEKELAEQKLYPSREALFDSWTQTVKSVFQRATLQIPSSDCFMLSGGKEGKHSEHLGHILAEMQILPRSHPKAIW